MPAMRQRLSIRCSGLFLIGMLGDETIDEAGHKLATVNVQRGRVLNMKRTTRFQPAERGLGHGARPR